MQDRVASVRDGVCIVDVGSTTTKAILFTHEDRWRCVRAESPTTVERPDEDVMIGVRRSLEALSARAGRALLEGDRPRAPLLCTSSAGGGLAMVVTGLVREVTSRSAARVALGAGAILLDVIAMDDGRAPYEKIEALRRLRPDMVLLAGGFDGEALSGPVFLAELVREAALRPKLSAAARLPVIYAGNVHATDLARETLGEGFLFHAVPNLRPASERENLEPARAAIHEIFMEHVMSQAPGYEALRGCVSAPILPTPAAFAGILSRASRRMDRKILAIDIGGATTDVFTARDGEVFRTVSANLGMSYSILEVARRGGVQAIREVLARDPGGGEISTTELWDEMGAKYLHPTRLPRGDRRRAIERAVGAIAIREAVREHLAVLRGASLSRGRDELTFDRFGSRPRRESPREERLALQGYDLVIGSGGLLSHSPRPFARRMLIEALQPRRGTHLAVDSAFMFPHLGALAEIDEDLALELFRELGLVHLEEDALGDSAARGMDRATQGEEGAAGAIPPEDPPVPPLPCSREPLTLRRELAIPGQVFVRAGETVASETLVARSTRQFLRPFFLDVTARIHAKPEELPACLRKRVGEALEPGDLVAERRASAFVTRHYLSPVAGRIERLLPNGTLVVREKAEDAQRLTAVPVAKDLRMRPDQIRPHLRVRVGQPVEREQWLASITRSGAPPLVSASPVRGRVREINLDYGVVTVEPLLESLDVRAWLPGGVTEVTERGCLVRGEGLLLLGVWGQGGEARGRLVPDGGEEGCVAVRDHATGAELDALERAGASGLVTGSLHLEDVLGRALPFTIVVMQGFGDRPLEAELGACLRARAGTLALLDGTTELRVGVRRPFVILAQGEEHA